MCDIDDMEPYNKQKRMSKRYGSGVEV
jgi:hypothetical protein